MPNGPTPDELAWRLDAHERRTTDEHKDLRDRIDRVATEAVQADVHDRIERDRDKELGKLDRRVETLEKANANRPGMTFTRWMQVLGVVAAFLAVLVTAWVATRGAK